MKRHGAHAAARHNPTLTLPGAAVHLAACLTMMMSSAALAQGAPSGQGLRLSTSLDSSASYVVNSRLGGRDEGELALELRPGLRIGATAGRVRGSFSYSLGLQYRTRNNDASDGINHNLAAQFTAEAVERWLYVDGTASISRQSTDPYGSQAAPGSNAADANRIEVATATLSPYVRGVLGGAVNYEVRLNASGTNARRSIASDSTTWGGVASLSSAVPGTQFGWGLVASSQETDFRASRSTRNDRWSASLSWLPNTDFSFVLRGGEEATDVGQPEQERYSNYGGGFTWRPSPRTRFQVDADERYFGSSYRVIFEHRLPQTSVTLGSSRSDNGGQPTRVPVTYFQLFDAQLAPLITDPAQRLPQVLALLQAQNLKPDDVAFVGFINSAVSVVERHDLSLAYTGRRLNAGLQVYFDTSRVLDSPLGNAPEAVKRKGAAFNAGYRLSPTSSLALGGTWLTTLPTSTRAGNNLKSVSLSLSEQLGLRTTAGLSLRYSDFRSSTEPYREAAVTASLNHRF